MDEPTMGGINMAVLSVLQLNEYVKGVLEDEPQLQAVAVKGEISNFIHHRSGHMYFTLKDEDSQIKAVMFKNANMRLQFRPKDGQKVVVMGSVSVYSPGGQYQLYVGAMKPDGIGDLYQAYEELKKRLSEEGLFDPIHKRPLPAFPQKIGVITSANGAAVRDIINVAGRRCPMTQLLLYPAQVQGAGTAAAGAPGHKAEVIVEQDMGGACTRYPCRRRSYIGAEALVVGTAYLGHLAVRESDKFLKGGGLVELPAVTDGRLHKNA